MNCKKFFSVLVILLLCNISAYAGTVEHNSPVTHGYWEDRGSNGQSFYSDEYKIQTGGRNVTNWASFDLSSSEILNASRVIDGLELLVYFEPPEDYPESGLYGYRVLAGIFGQDITDPETQYQTSFPYNGIETTLFPSYQDNTSETRKYIRFLLNSEETVNTIRQAAQDNNGKVSVGFYGNENVPGYEASPLVPDEVEMYAVTHEPFESATITNVTSDSQGTFTFEFTSDNSYISDDDQYLVEIIAKTDVEGYDQYAHVEEEEVWFNTHRTEDNGSGTVTISANILLDTDEVVSGNYYFMMRTVNRVYDYTHHDSSRIYRKVYGPWNEYNSPYELSVSEETVTIPVNTEISNAYPNPFNGTTNINFQLSKSGIVSLKLYDIQGRQVRSLMNQDMNAGQHKFSLEVTDLPSGTYFVRMDACNTVSVKKVMLLK